MLRVTSEFLILLICSGFASSRNSGWGPSKPRSIAPTRIFEGDDGLWSTFDVTIGSPEQTVRLLPATSVNAVWPVLPEGCEDDPDPTNCPNDRGGAFVPGKSHTWRDIGIYELGLLEETDLGYSGNASFGYDNVMLGVPGSGVPTLQHQVIEGFATKDFYFGALGLYPELVNITTLNNSSKSLLGSLRAVNAVPGTSWSYTAGSSAKNVWGSLVFGGFDTTRFNKNKLSIAFSPDNTRDIVVGITSIKNSTGSELLSGGNVAAFLDSLVPDMWLPVSTCKAFEDAFNLTWDSTVERYLLDSDQRQQLASSHASITFEIRDPATISLAGSRMSRRSTKTTASATITMPYSSFILKAQSPFATPAALPSPTVYYFPLRRATEEAQYTLGRAFFQDAYVTADYDRSKFTVSQALFPSAYKQENLVAIHAPGSSSGLSTGAKVGIAVPLVVVPLYIIGCWFWLRRRRRRRQLGKGKSENQKDQPSELDGNEKPRVELSGGQEAELRRELTGKAFMEMSAETYLRELSGSPVSKGSVISPNSLEPPQELDSTPVMARLEEEYPGDEKSNGQGEEKESSD